jgi:hypothetical protein
LLKNESLIAFALDIDQTMRGGDTPRKMRMRSYMATPFLEMTSVPFRTPGIKRH